MKNIHLIPSEEPKQETTLEEDDWLSKIQPSYDTKESYQHGFHDAIQVVKDHQEASAKKYSEEDMKQFAFECVGKFLSNDDNKVEIKLVHVIIDRLNKHFEQFKK